MGFKRKIIVGGEHIITPRALFRKSHRFIDNLIYEFKDEYYVNFTFGGYYSILAIIDAIKAKFEDDSYILLPSFLCPSILKPFKLRGIKYLFYKVDDELFIDIDYLNTIINHNDKIKAVFFIDYFGANQKERILPLLNKLKSKNIYIIQDVVQCLKIRKEQLYGDFIFNSFRKFFPFEGSMLITKERINIKYGKDKTKYIKYKRIGQILRYLHITYGIFSEKLFLNFLQIAEKNYYSEEVLKMPKFNHENLNKIDINLLIENQTFYYNQLLNIFNDKVPDLLLNNNFIPLGFIIKLDKRDIIRNYLFEQNIFTPIHWKLSNEIDKKKFEKSILLSSKILTLPLIGLSQRNFQYLMKTSFDLSLN